MAKIGLVAGYGKITKLFADAAKARGDTVVAIALKGVTEEDLAGHVEKMYWFEWGEFQKALMIAIKERLNKIVLLGKIQKDLLFKGDEKLDSRSKDILTGGKDRKDYSILKQVANVVGKFGIEIMDPTIYLNDLIPAKGVLTKRRPTPEEEADIQYGKEIASKLAQLDIGQTVAVKNKTVIAVEAVEGTDETLKRAGALSKVGFVMVKAARPAQDMRFDVPLIGLETLKTLIEASGSVLALEAGKTLLIDKDEMIALADQKNISIVII